MDTNSRLQSWSFLGRKERLNNSDGQQVPLTVNLLQDNLFHLIPREMNLPHDERFTLQPTQYENNPVKSTIC